LVPSGFLLCYNRYGVKGAVGVLIEFSEGVVIKDTTLVVNPLFLL